MPKTRVCPLCPRKQTSRTCLDMSASCHKQTLALQQEHSVDHVVGTCEQCLVATGKFAFAARDDLNCAPPQHPTCIRLPHYKLHHRMDGTAEPSHRSRDIDDQNRA